MFQNKNLENIVIREFKRDDLSSVQRIFSNGFNKYRDGPTGVVSDYFLAERLQDDMFDIQESYLNVDGGNFWVAEDTSPATLDNTMKSPPRIVGIVGILPGSIINEKGPISDDGNNATGKVLELLRMSVHEDYQGTGVAQLLLGELEKFAFEKHNCHKVFLATGYDMKCACRFYEKQGYKKTHTMTKKFHCLDYPYQIQYFEKLSL